jgi:quercetin dioxygenase-like cupin family protein
VRVPELPAFVRNNPAVDFPFPGVRGWLLQNGRQQTVFAEFVETVDVPAHRHADQWEIVVAGRVELHRNGGTEVFGPGDNFFVPAGEDHAATVHAGYQAVIIFDAPDRYRAQEGQD